MRHLALAAAVALSVAAAASGAMADCFHGMNGECVGTTIQGIAVSGSCCPTNYQSPPEPAAAKPPRENIEILLKRARDETADLEASWFKSGSQLSAARAKAETYRKLLADLPEPQP